MSELPIIDSHVLLGEEYHLRLHADELLRRMDAAGIEMAIARPMGGELAVYNVEGNNRVLHSHPRIKAMVSVSPWYGNNAIDELRRCRDAGAVGLFLHPTRQGFMPGDDMVKPILDFATEVGWPVMFHTGTYINSDILSLGEVAREYSGINFIAGFGGFTDMWFELPGIFRDVPNLFLDASMIWSSAVRQIIDECGADRVLYGSAEPRGRHAAGLNAIARLGLNDAQSRAFFGGNTRRLFKL